MYPRSVDYLNPRVSAFIDKGSHFSGDGITAFGCSSAPVTVPHIADDDGSIGYGNFSGFHAILPFLTTLGCLYLCTERQFQHSGGFGTSLRFGLGFHLHIPICGPVQGISDQALELFSISKPPSEV